MGMFVGFVVALCEIVGCALFVRTPRDSWACAGCVISRRCQFTSLRAQIMVLACWVRDAGRVCAHGGGWFGEGKVFF